MDQLDHPEQNQEPAHGTTTASGSPDEEVSQAPAMRAFSAFRHRNYKLFFGGQVVSLTGTWLQSVAQGYFVYQLTNSKFMLGMVSSVGSLPVLVLCLFAGVLADRVNKRNLIMFTQACAALLAFTLAMLITTHVVTIYHIFVIACLLGVVQAFDVTTRQSFIVEMVGKDDLPNAIALNSATFNIARIIGPALAGVVIAHLGIEMAFFLNAASFLPVILGLGMMRVEPVVHAEHEPMMHQLREGFRFVRGHRVIRSLIINTAVISIFAMPYAILMPIFARDILHAGAKGLGYLVSSIGAGALIGALVLSWLGNFAGKVRMLFAGTLTFALAITLFSFSRTLPLSMALLVCAGWGMMTNMALTNTLIQTYCPDGLRGRVVSVYILFNMGMGPIGSFQAGTIAQWFGAPTALRIGVIAIVTAVTLLAPGLIRDERRLCS